jgi:hypothetical protein
VIIIQNVGMQPFVITLVVNVLYMRRILRAFNLELRVKFWLEFGINVWPFCTMCSLHSYQSHPTLTNNLSMLRVSSFEMILLETTIKGRATM